MEIKNRKTIRLKNYDYSQSGYYFVTVCVQNRQCCLGKIENREMILNEFGRIVKKQWLWLKQQYASVDLDIFQIMPNHFHGILVLVGNGRDHSLQAKIKPVPQLIGAFKTTSSKDIHLQGLPNFSWQKSFYDHIIRKDGSLDKIREYILNNPKQWEMDEDNPKNNPM